MTGLALLQADARRLPLADASVHCVVTSPPYWQQRDYGTAEQLGREPVHDCLGWATGARCGACYVCRMVEAFAEVWRVLRPEGTTWLNLGDTYASGGWGGGYGAFIDDFPGRVETAKSKSGYRAAPAGLKDKDLAGIPWRVALALQAAGWVLRSDIIWAKPNPMPSSIHDRPTTAHEHIFLLAKQRHYYYDHDAVREPATGKPQRRLAERKPRAGHRAPQTYSTATLATEPEHDSPDGRRNLRTVWTEPVGRYSGAHFAAFPERLVEPCILAGCPRGGVVLDPFAGSGTTGRVALRLGRSAILCDLSREYLTTCARERTSGIQVDLL